MTSLSKVIIIGRVGKDPEIKSFDIPGKVGGTTDKKEIAHLSVATSDSYTKNNGEKVVNTHWHKVVINNSALVNIVKNYVTKGSQIYIEGELKYRQYEDKEQKKQTITEIVLSPYRGSLLLLDKKDKSDESKPVTQTKHQGSQANFAYDDLDDEIPF